MCIQDISLCYIFSLHLSINIDLFNKRMLFLTLLNESLWRQYLIFRMFFEVKRPSSDLARRRLHLPISPGSSGIAMDWQCLRHWKGGMSCNMASPLPMVNRSCILCIWRKRHGGRKGRKGKQNKTPEHGTVIHKNSYTYGSELPRSLSKEENSIKNTIHSYIQKTKTN